MTSNNLPPPGSEHNARLAAAERSVLAAMLIGSEAIGRAWKPTPGLGGSLADLTRLLNVPEGRAA